MELAPLYDFCPSCGNMDCAIIEETGWCRTCTANYFPDHLVCLNCLKLFPKSRGGKLCWSCKHERWLEKNADILESFLQQGYSLSQAKRMVSATLVPTCLVCGDKIKFARQTDIFCRKTVECRKARRRLRTIRESLNGKNAPELALAIVKKELGIGDGLTRII